MQAFEQSLHELETGDVVVVGVPFDANSSFLRGAARGPSAIRAALRSGSANLCAEGGLDLGTAAGWRDLGDLEWSNESAAFGVIERRVGALLERGARVVTLGGDHSISYPVMRAYARHHDNLHILHFDAHPDLYDEYDGNRHSHASPFARIMENGLARRLVQVGIRTLDPHQRAQAARFGVEHVEMRHFRPDLQLEFDGPVYISLDIDCLDPAYAPGVSHREPGGLSTRDVLGLIERVRAPWVGADLVELNPSQDVGGLTAMVGAKLLKELVAGLLQRSS